MSQAFSTLSRYLLIGLYFFLTLLISACAHVMQPQKLVGQNEQQALAAWGAPSAQIPMSQGGMRLQYSGQPWGRYVWNIDLDASGTVTQVYQALQNMYFSKIPTDGSWTRDDVLKEFGSPAFVDHVASWQGDIWNYRWWDIQDMFYYIYFDSQGRVRKAHAGIDDASDRFDWTR